MLRCVQWQCIINVCVDLLFFYIQNFYTSYYTYNSERRQWWSYKTLLEPLFYPVWNSCHSQLNGRSWMTTSSLQMKWNSNKHQQSQLDDETEWQKCEKNCRTDKTDSMRENVLDCWDNNLSFAVILKARVTVQWRNNLINKK